MHITSLPRLHFAQLPTPLEEMHRLSDFLGGPRLFIKRDDQTGLALGGNKTRKLEFLIADALAQKADTILTAGAAQSNHCRQTAAAAARAGLRCELILGGEAPETPNGNLLLDRLLGANIHWTRTELRVHRMEEIAGELRQRSRKPYVIPYGGSNAVGATGFALAMLELKEQMNLLNVKVDTIIVASSSGGTQAGMAVGARVAGFQGKIMGISIDKGERGVTRYEVELAHLARDIARHIGAPETFVPQDFFVKYDYLGGGYGVVGEPEREAIRLAAELEGIILDPVYTGRALAGLIDMVRRKFLSGNETVLFWHTGGAPALFAYASEMNQAPAL